MNPTQVKSLYFLLVAAFVLGGCASSQQKARKDQRDKLIQTSKLYCEYINGEQFHDVDVALNISMGQKCDSDKPFSISQYRTPNEIQGMMFCCGVSSSANFDPIDKKAEKKAEPKKVDKKEEPKKSDEINLN